MIEIDGALGEGGGQVVRTAVSLAAITGQGVEITNVRARRERPGLQPQHLAAVRAASSLCGATLVGDHVGSRHLLLEPSRRAEAGDFGFDVRTAGAATLVTQTVLVPLLCVDGASTVEVTGGTHQPMSPSADYLQHAYAPALRDFGAEVDVEYGPAGYYPRGGGRVRSLITGARLRPVELVSRGARTSLDAFVVTSGLDARVGERGAGVVAERLPDANVVSLRPEAFSRGAAVTIVCSHECGRGGFSSIGRPGLPMENVASDACDQFERWNASSAAVDERLSDQLVLPASMTTGTSRWTTPRVTRHLETVLTVVEEFLPIGWTISDGCVELTGAARDRTPDDQV